MKLGKVEVFISFLYLIEVWFLFIITDNLIFATLGTVATGFIVVCLFGFLEYLLVCGCDKDTTIGEAWNLRFKKGVD